jgi:uncharacterized protein with HEPN domain
MKHDDLIRVQHMIDASTELLSFIENKKRNDLDNDRMLVLSVIKEIEIIGEAANKVSNELKEQFPDIPWSEIINMRNRLIHTYFDIDTEIVWSSITQDVPQLLTMLRILIDQK